MRATAALAAALGTAVVLALFGGLLSPEVALATRDVAFFHLPLHADFARLVAQGSPSWNPWLHGGQPVLSNPSYSTFYPPMWLFLVASPVCALSLLVLLHAAVAFAGSWYFARRLGCEPAAAALAAVAYTAGGGYVSLVHALNLMPSMAWLPWALAAGDAILRHPVESGLGWLRPAAGCAAVLALQILNGEPVTVLVSGLGLAALAVGEARRPGRVLRLVVPVAVAALIAAIQVVPTWERLRDSPRAGPLEPAQANVWSAPPARLAELVLPRLFGDPSRPRERFYFGWSLHDKHYPYLISIYPGLLISVLALSALARWPVRRRAAWLAAGGAAVFLGLGRHNPLYNLFQQHLPLLDRVRYPEKFLLLLVAILPFAAALGWQRLIDDRRRGEARAGDLPIALALAVGAIAAAVVVWVGVAPAAAGGFVRAGAGRPLSPVAVAAGVGFLAGEAWIAIATAAATAVVIALVRCRRLPPPAVGALAVALVVADLWRCSHGLVTLVPADEYRRPPPAAAAAIASRDRVFSDEVVHQDDDLVMHSDEPELDYLRTKLQRLDPYVGNLWGIAYAFNRDYDLMLTGWGRRARAVLVEEWTHPSRAVHLLGAWNVGTVVMRRPTKEMLAELARGEEEIAPALVYSNPEVLPRFRFVPEVAFHADAAEARAAARAGGYDLSQVDHWIGPGRPPGEDPGSPPAELLTLVDLGGRVDARYRAPGGGFLVDASTFDHGWRAAVDGRPVATYPTAVGQIGIEVPAGEHRLELRYRTPRLAAGAAISAAGLLLLAAMPVVAARSRRRDAPPPVRDGPPS